MVSASELLTFHGAVAREFIRILQRQVRFHPDATRASLLHLRAGAISAYELAPADNIVEFALSRGRAFVFPLVPVRQHDKEEWATPRTWVGWLEKWRCIDQDEFDLEAAAWTLYWGYSDDERKAQILRAEWDQLYRIDRTASNAGHPHWHVDASIPLTRANYAKGRKALQEISDTPPRAIAIERLHLAMGGWQNNPGEAAIIPRCWQHEFRGSCDDLADWAVRTLRYLQTQSHYLRTN
jgi:hypothetical protein